MRQIPEVHVHFELSNELNQRFYEVIQKLDQVLTEISRLSQEEKRTMADLNELTEEVTNNTDVVASAVTLIAGLADQLEAAATDPAAVQALANTLRTNNQSLAAAVAANTPVAPPET